MKKFTIKDIAAGENFSLILIEVDKKSKLLRFGTGFEDKYMEGKIETEEIVSTVYFFV